MFGGGEGIFLSYKIKGGGGGPRRRWGGGGGFFAGGGGGGCGLSFSVEVKAAWSYTSTPPYVFMACTGQNFTLSCVLYTY